MFVLWQDLKDYKHCKNNFWEKKFDFSDGWELKSTGSKI